MRYIVVFLLTISSLGCMTNGQFDFETATETVNFVDTVLTVLENHGVSLEGITQYIIEAIEEQRKEDDSLTPEDVAREIWVSIEKGTLLK